MSADRGGEYRPGPSGQVIGQLHHVVEQARRIVATDVQERELPRFAQRDFGEEG